MASFTVKKCIRQTSKLGAYKVYTNKDGYSVGKYASCHVVATSVRAWRKAYPNLNENTMRGFKKRYEAKLKEASRKECITQKEAS